MRYKWQGEIYQTRTQLLAGPVRRDHPDARRCFTEKGFFVVCVYNAFKYAEIYYHMTILGPDLIEVGDRITDTPSSSSD